MNGVEFASASGSMAASTPFLLLTATCPNGKRPTGASYSVNAGSFWQGYSVTLLRPTATGYDMGVSGGNTAGFTANISLTVRCVALTL